MFGTCDSTLLEKGMDNNNNVCIWLGEYEKIFLENVFKHLETAVI